MSTTSLRFERTYEFAPAIVWDALVDADLVSGWLAEAVVDPRRGGEFILRWHDRESAGVSVGTITRFEPRTALEVTGADGATTRFTLAEVTGGNRGTSTVLTVEIESPLEQAFAHGLKARWLNGLDQLTELLRGHPVDWKPAVTDEAQVAPVPAWVELLGERNDAGSSSPNLPGEGTGSSRTGTQHDRWRSD